MSLLSRNYFRRSGFFASLLSVVLSIALLSPTALGWQQGATATQSTGTAVARQSVATLTIGKGPDGATFDPASQSAFASNSDGTLTVVHEDDPNHFRVVATVATPNRARTITLDEKKHRVVLPFAEFGPAPSPSTEDPHPRPVMKADSFGFVVVGQR